MVGIKINSLWYKLKLMQKTRLKLILAGGIFVFFGVLFSYKLVSAFNFHGDFGRDLTEVSKICAGDPTLVGPDLTFGGLKTGPYWFYFLTIPYCLSNQNFISVLYFNSLFTSGILALIFWYLSGKMGMKKALVAILLVGTLPLFMTVARDPWNAYAYLPLMALAFAYFFLESKWTTKKLIFLGLLLGLILNIHPVGIASVIVIGIYLLFKVRFKIFFLILSALLTVLPLLVFDLSHEFIISKSIFVYHQQDNFVNAVQLADAPKASTNPLKNTITLLKASNAQIPMVYLTVLLFFAGLSLLGKQKLTKSNLKKDSLNANFKLVWVPWISLLLFATIARFQLTNYYALSYVLMLYMALILIISKSSRSYLLWLVLLLQFGLMPQVISKKSQPTEFNGRYFHEITRSILSKNLVNKNDSFNVFYSSKDGKDYPHAFQLRSFFIRYGYRPLPVHDYGLSDKVLVYTDRQTLNVSKLETWETAQFGQKYFDDATEYALNKGSVFLVSKN